MAGYATLGPFSCWTRTQSDIGGEVGVKLALIKSILHLIMYVHVHVYLCR